MRLNQQQPNPAHETFRRSDGYAVHVITIGERNRLSEAQLYDIIVGVRQSIRQSYCFLAEPYTAFAIEDTIRTAIHLSATFRNALAFSGSRERRDAGVLRSQDITRLHYRNLYVMRQYRDRRRLDQLSLTEILTATAETVPIVPEEVLAFEDARDPDLFVSISISPNHNSVHYPFWQTGLIHEIIHAITDAGDPPENEQTARLGPTEILANQIAREISWNIPVFTAYDSVDRNEFISEYEFQSLRQGIYRHHQRGYELLERLCDINHLLTSSPNFAGIDTLSDECLIPTHSSDEDTPAHWGAFILGGAHATHQRKDVFATKYKNIVFNKEELPLTQWHLEKYGLVIAEKAVNRVEHGSGFYKKKYKSWKEWYQSLAWKHVFGYGIHGYGQAEAEGYFIYSPYGEIFEDGSFAVGITGTDIKKWGHNDNWTNLAGENWSSASAGQMYFDKNGRPVAIVMTNPITGFFGAGWSFIYNEGKWEYESKDDWDKHRFSEQNESLDRYAARFLIKNI